MLEGIDFAFGSGLTTGQVKNGGKAFVCRYLSGGNSKDITAAELSNYHAAGIPVVFVWETDGIMRSQSEGVSHAKSADAQLGRLGAHGAPVFFAADAATVPDLAGYLKGAVSVIGKARTGVYGGLANVKAAFDHGLASFGWQTYAWSGGQWDDRALLRQYRNNVRFGPATVDMDEAAFWSSSKILTVHDDFGQWPRPSAPAPVPPSGPYRHVAPDVGGESLGHVADARHTTVGHILSVSQAHLSPEHLTVLKAYIALEDAMIAAQMPRPTMPMDLIYWTDGP
jgi:Domain of unknown function (DUF1906)